MCLATLGIVGAATSAVGSVFGGIASANQANYQAEVAKNNAKIAEQNATQATEAGEAQAQAESEKGAQVAGGIIAAQAANGIDVNSGSAVDVQQSQREESKLDTNTVMHNAELSAYGYRTQSTNYQAQAELDKTQAAEAPIAAAIGATGSFLSNASSISSKWTGAQASS
ncbi:hypothetical protein FHT86_002139 [Rhizobium sp. BK313]|uniref:hypothetical protein n=1 Tax=Rhizobium sp. BK313 TaxID=2587081 RepID=UPI00161D8BAE|nr:hypothetical protein [Rhizobium sp. BK313]MBB3453883.1 hypothetical protein [Rhizobium sp. BK313]